MKTAVRLLAILALAGATAAYAQGYPNHLIKVVVPWPPGGEAGECETGLNLRRTVNLTAPGRDAEQPEQVPEIQR